jgi:hypothetical protein
MTVFGRKLFGTLLAALGGGWLSYYVSGAMLQPASWQANLLVGSFGLIPLVAGFLLVSRN